MSFDHIKENFAEYCLGIVAVWVISLMALDMAGSVIKSVQHDPHDRNACGCIVKDGIEICEKL